jgi:hypothetical protein
MFGVLALLLVISPPHFRAAPGWHVGASGPHACAWVSASRCVWAAGWAGTVRYRDCPNCVAPHRTLARLPAEGILIQLTKTCELPARMRTGSWPPTIRRKDVQPGFEGVTPRYGSFQFTVRTGKVERSLFVWFGRARPTRDQLARANAELRTAR